MSDRPVVLTGFMGSGKTSVGRVLAGTLGWPLVDLDAAIVAKAGRSINDIFARDGEPFFRALESECLEEELRRGKRVIACGGGVVISGENRRLMRELGFVVNLKASLATVLQRLEGATDRPLYNREDGGGRVAALMEEREPYYCDADIRIDTDRKSVEDVAAEILGSLKGLPA